MPGILDLPPWPGDAYPNEVTLHVRTETVSDRGTVIPGWDEPGVEWPASVQPGTVRREEPDGTLREVAGVMILTAENPRVRLGDQFRWLDPSTGELRTFQVAGRATDEGGIGDGWTTPTLEVT